MVFLFLALILTKRMTRMYANWLCFSTGRRTNCGWPTYFERKAEIVAVPSSKSIHSHISVEVVSFDIKLTLGLGFKMRVKTRTD